MPTSAMTTAVGVRSSLRRVAAISASLVGTYALTSVLGLFFWLLAARQFSVSSVGVGGAAIALMTLLGTLGTVATLLAFVVQFLWTHVVERMSPVLDRMSTQTPGPHPPRTAFNPSEGKAHD